MLDIKFIRENPDLVGQAARKKHIDFDVNKLLEIDDARRKLLAEIEDLRAKQNKASDNVAQIEDEAQKQASIESLREVKEHLVGKEKEFKKLDEEWKSLMLSVPNIPDPSVPEGEGDTDNKEVRRWAPTPSGRGSDHSVGGNIPQFDFEFKDHIALIKGLDLADLERGSKAAGFRGYFLKNEGALLSLALWQYAIDSLRKKGFVPFVAPSLVREESFLGTGWLPQGKDEVYQTQDDLYLAGTAEVPMMGFHMDEVLKEEELPKKYAAISVCYRREAGSYGKDTKGLMRVHEFIKVEQVILCLADHEESVRWHEEITKNAEEMMQELKVPYRVVVNCGGDLGLGQVKKYDIEAFVPSQERYRETHSSSYFHDFQTRRLNIRYKTNEGKMLFAHSLNNTMVATPRILIAILENYQQKDGSILVPEVLRKYLGKEIIKRE